LSFSEDPRFRISTKQTAKNFWQIDATVEYKSDKISMSPQVGKDTVQTTLGLRLLSLIKETEKEFRADGRKIVGDEL
jgi:hypothetical protein